MAYGSHSGSELDDDRYRQPRSLTVINCSPTHDVPILDIDTSKRQQFRGEVPIF